MDIHVGESRVVITIPTLRIVIKFPIVHILSASKVLWPELRHPRHLWREVSNFTTEVDSSLKRLLAKGLMDNWREFVFYLSSRHPLVQPTYFSMFGVFNIQLYGKPCGCERTLLWAQLYELTSGAVFADGHHFANPNNFSLVLGRLRILDYGSKRTQGVIREHGSTILEQFDPQWKKSLRT
jgi:hypothetical protein